MTIQRLCLTPGSPLGRRREDASAVIIVVILVAIVLIYVGANVRTLHQLGQELRLIERQQVRRLQTLSVKPTTPGQKTEADVAPATAIPTPSRATAGGQARPRSFSHASSFPRNQQTPVVAHPPTDLTWKIPLASS